MMGASTADVTIPHSDQIGLMLGRAFFRGGENFQLSLVPSRKEGVKRALQSYLSTPPGISHGREASSPRSSPLDKPHGPRSPSCCDRQVVQLCCCRRTNDSGTIALSLHEDPSHQCHTEEVSVEGCHVPRNSPTTLLCRACGRTYVESEICKVGFWDAYLIPCQSVSSACYRTTGLESSATERDLYCFIIPCTHRVVSIQKEIRSAHPAQSP